MRPLLPLLLLLTGCLPAPPDKAEAFFIDRQNRVEIYALPGGTDVALRAAQADCVFRIAGALWDGKGFNSPAPWPGRITIWSLPQKRFHDYCPTTAAACVHGSSWRADNRAIYIHERVLSPLWPDEGRAVVLTHEATHLLGRHAGYGADRNHSDPRRFIIDRRRGNTSVEALGSTLSRSCFD